MASTITLNEIVLEAGMSKAMRGEDQAVLLQYAISGLQQLDISLTLRRKTKKLPIDKRNYAADLPDDYMALERVVYWSECTKRLMSLSADPNLILGLEEGRCSCEAPNAGELDTTCNACGLGVGYSWGMWWNNGWYGNGYGQPFSAYSRIDVQDPQNGRVFGGISDNNPYGYYNIIDNRIFVQRCTVPYENGDWLGIIYAPTTQVTTDQMPVPLYAKEALLAYIRYRWYADNVTDVTMAKRNMALDNKAIWETERLEYQRNSMAQNSSIQDLFRVALMMQIPSHT